jgi:hypothetical protein
VRATAAQYALQTGEPTRLRPAIAAMLRDPWARVRRALLVANGDGRAVLRLAGAGAAQRRSLPPRCRRP